MRSLALVCTMTLLAGLMAGCGDPKTDDAPFDAPVQSDGRGDAVVVAVIDGGFDPYHYDFLASQMPQALNDDPSDDLPLTADPAAWLPGYPGDDAKGLTRHALPLNLPTEDNAVPQKLHDADSSAWGDVAVSSPDSVHMYWIPGTKVVGYVNFGGGGDGFSPNSHGVGTSSVSVGNLHGACPECLFVFVHGTTEEANRWVESQDWIDAQTNSWGISSNPVGLPRDRVYTGSDTEAQRTAIERGQAIFFSAGNGLLNDFSAPNPTLLSSQEGPDWIITVGAVTPGNQAAYSGAGKPADVANIGSDYPSAGGESVTADSTFGGTSNATPVTAGEYARALYLLRREAYGDNRAQKDGQIVMNGACNDTVSAEPVSASSTSGRDRDGEDMAPVAASCVDQSVTVHQLRNALYAAAADPSGVLSAGGLVDTPELTPEETFAAFGHGVFIGRLNGMNSLEAETQAIAAAVHTPPEMSQDETDWFVADSYCRQGIWGTWTFGDYLDGESDLPGADPAWPVRSYYAMGCPDTLGTVKNVLDAVLPLPLA